MNALLLLLAACGPGPGGDTKVPVDSNAESVPGESTWETAASHPPVRLSEVMSDNHDTLEDGDGDSSDWIELYNPGPDVVDLVGWALSDDPANPARYVFPALPMTPGGYLLVYASGKGAAGPAGELHTSFQLDATGEVIVLSAPDGAVVDTLVAPPLGEDVAYGRTQAVSNVALVPAHAAARWTLAGTTGWESAGFDDAAWAAGTLALGFDGTVSDGTTVDAALEKPATQSSDGYGYTGAQAVDGEPGTFSHTADGDLTPWLAVDFEAAYNIDSITILNRTDCCAERLYNVTVTLLDGAGAPVWMSDVVNPVEEGTTPTAPANRIDLVPPSPVIARGLRVSKVAVNGAGSSEWLSIADLVATGTLAAPYADRITTDIATAMAGVSATAYVRVPFVLDTPAPTAATLTLAYDDGVAAWVNGAPLMEENIGEGAATAAHDGTAEVVVPLDPALLTNGVNLLALEGMNLAASDDDFLLDARLDAAWITTGDVAFFQTPTPGAPNGAGVAGFVAAPTVSVPRGFYDAPQTVTLTTATPGATLVYTLDGSAPTEAHGIVVPPADAATAPATRLTVPTTTLLRAAAFLDGWAPSPVVTDTWLFLDDVVHQPAAPPGVPGTWDGVSEAVTADYEMDPEVVDDPAYTTDLLAGLREIPTLSVVMDPEDLFGANGIYPNSAERGDAWKRPASVELILSDGSTGFAETCEIEIHGWGWRANSVTPKHSFRLEFKPEYGARKLEYPWFPDAPITSFDSIVLRAGGSKTFLDFRDPDQAQYLHDAFARDTARDMGKVDGHATFVHLYLNGLYWGLYNPVERPEAEFGQSYFGGDDDEYDAINRRTVTNEAIDGTLDAYNALLALADKDLTVPASYDAVGAMLDLDDLADYMLIHQYMTNRDGPCCAESNNMRAVRRRVEGEKFRFFVWDMEYSLWDPSEDTNVNIDVAGAIAHVYTRLRDNPDFRARYAARARLHLTGDGALTPAAASARYAARGDEIHDAIVGESARWGDARRAEPYTRDVEWQAEYDRLMTTYFPNRTQALIDQLTAAGLYTP